MGFKNFTEYWEARKTILEKLGVSEDAAKMIWNDACDTIAFVLIDNELRKLQ
jgi:hypothetical protein